MSNYSIIESIGNHSYTHLETFDTIDEASEALENIVSYEVLEDFRRDGITSLCDIDNNLLEMARETAHSYYNIEEVAE